MEVKRIKEIHQDLPAYETAARAHERDNGRRGEPLPGCDCLRCFGRCSIDQDVAVRQLLARQGQPDELNGIMVDNGPYRPRAQHVPGAADALRDELDIFN